MTDLQALIDRLEKAKDGSMDLDKAILVYLGYTWRGMAYWHHDEKTMWTGPVCFTRLLDDAMALAVRLLDTGAVDIEVAHRSTGGKAYGRAEICGPHVDSGARAATPALALVIATLKARAVQENRA